MSGAWMNEEERGRYKEALWMKNRSRFSRKNINEYVTELLGECRQISVTEVLVTERRDLIRIIYISIYAGNCSNNYTIKRSKEREQIGEFSLPYFDILKKD